MRQLLAIIWWWIRVAVLVLAIAYAIALLWNNSGKAEIWYWPGRPKEETTILAFGAAAFLSGGIVMTIGWALFKASVTYRRSKAARHRRLIEQQREEATRKAAMLRTKPAPTPVPRTIKEMSKETAKPREVELQPAVEPVPEATTAIAPVVVPQASTDSKPAASKGITADLAATVPSTPATDVKPPPTTRPAPAAHTEDRDNGGVKSAPVVSPESGSIAVQKLEPTPEAARPVTPPDAPISATPPSKPA